MEQKNFLSNEVPLNVLWVLAQGQGSSHFSLSSTFLSPLDNRISGHINFNITGLKTNILLPWSQITIFLISFLPITQNVLEEWSLLSVFSSSPLTPLLRARLPGPPLHWNCSGWLTSDLHVDNPTNERYFSVLVSFGLGGISCCWILSPLLGTFLLLTPCIAVLANWLLGGALICALFLSPLLNTPIMTKSNSQWFYNGSHTTASVKGIPAPCIPLTWRFLLFLLVLLPLPNF